MKNVFVLIMLAILATVVFSDYEDDYWPSSSGNSSNSSDYSYDYDVEENYWPSSSGSANSSGSSSSSRSPVPQYGGQILCIDQSITNNGYVIILNSIIKPAVLPDKASLTVTRGGSVIWGPTLNLDGMPHIYIDKTKNKNLSVQVYSVLGSDCIEIKTAVSSGSASSTPSSSNPNSCTDKDGINYFVASTIVYSDSYDTNKPLADYCWSKDTLMERTCNGVYPSYVNYECPSGYGCYEGACVAETEQPEDKCTETDDGVNYLTWGVTKGKLDTTGVFDKYQDTCTTKLGGSAETTVSKYIKEFYCGNDGKTHVKYDTCPGEYMCDDGQCVLSYETEENSNQSSEQSATSITCSDSDGSNIYNKGTAKGWNYYKNETIFSSDYCTATDGGAGTFSGAYVAEEQCDADGKVHTYYYKCPEGYKCGDGACLSTNETEIIPLLPTSNEMKKYYTVELKNGWNLFSFPVKELTLPETRAKISATTCNADSAYAYNQYTKTYDKFELKVGEYLPVPDALWVKSDSSCKIAAEGTYTNEYDQGFKVPAGWLAIGGPYKTAKWNNVAGNCVATSGPWRFDTSAWKWEKSSELKPGEGYFVKIKEACTLGGNEGLPPSPPE